MESVEGEGGEGLGVVDFTGVDGGLQFMEGEANRVADVFVVVLGE